MPCKSEFFFLSAEALHKQHGEHQETTLIKLFRMLPRISALQTKHL